MSTGITLTISNNVITGSTYSLSVGDGSKTAVIPDTVTAIGNSAFSSLGNNLTSINLETSFVKSIGTNAFQNCSGLTNAILPSTITSIAFGAFSSCGNITNFLFPPSLTSVGVNALAGCNALKIINGDNLKNNTLGGGVFSLCLGLTSVTIPSNITNTVDTAFYGSQFLREITLLNNSLGSYTFMGCFRFTSLTIPTSITSIGVECFNGCRGLTSITIPHQYQILGTVFFKVVLL
jgi:hypothetical protein